MQINQKVTLNMPLNKIFNGRKGTIINFTLEGFINVMLDNGQIVLCEKAVITN